MIFDSHIHVWNRETPDTPWRESWRKHAHGPSFSAEDALEAMSGAGVQRAALLPAAWDVGGNDLVLASAARFPERFVAFVAPDMRQPAGAAGLEDWRRRGAQGFRVMFPPGSKSSWLVDGTADWFWSAAEEVALPVMTWAPGQQAALEKVAERHPRLKLLIDHLNLGMDGFTEKTRAAVIELCCLARLPNIAVKASALPCEEAGAAALLRLAVKAFGADRVFWGSDLGRLPCTYTEAVSIIANGSWASAETDRELVLGDGFQAWIGQNRK